MRTLVPLLAVLATVLGEASAKVFGKCELATLLETVHGFPREDVKKWVCIAQYESTFNTNAVNKFNRNGSKDFGLFQVNNKYWCDANYGKNVCGMPCSDLLDDDLTDDLACIRKIIRDTERWKGKGTGYTAWVAYTSRCKDRDLDEYMSECWSRNPNTANNINNRDVGKVPESAHTENGAGVDFPIINNARVPIRFNILPYFRPLYQQVQPTSGAVVPNVYSYIYPHGYYQK